MRMPVHLLTQPYDDVDGDADSDEEVEIDEDTRPYEDIFSELENVCELIHHSCAANISTSQARQAKVYDARHCRAPLGIGDLIMNYNMKAKQRKGDRMALNWTGPYTIIKVYKNGNCSVKNAKGEVLTTKMCASNVKLWQELTGWENEPAPDWISAQNLDISEPTVSASPLLRKDKKERLLLTIVKKLSLGYLQRLSLVNVIHPKSLIIKENLLLRNLNIPPLLKKT